MFTSIGIPHGFCYLWNPALLWLHVSSDALIALAYFLIPFALLRIVARRRDIPYNGILLCFGLFIVACGLTHVMEIVTLWHPLYWISGGLKAFTALISLATFIVLLRLTPAILAIPNADSLQEANRKLNSVMESTTVGMYAVDQNWKFSFMNGTARALLSPDAAIIGQGLWECFPNQAKETQEKLLQVMETRKPLSFESYYEPLDLWSQVNVNPWSDGGVTVFFNDVSAEKRLQRELEREKLIREQRIASLAQMAAGLAHEISNPLGIIHARASDLLEQVEDGLDPTPAEVAAACNSIVKTSNRAIQILRGLRMFAREGGKDPMALTSVAPLVEQAVALVHERFHTHGIALTCEMEPELAPIVCREVQVGQIIFNLLNNAFDAIDGSPDSERWVRLDVRQRLGEILIEVVDGGPGVPEQHKPYLMQPFFTTKAVGAGMGVGLSLSRAIARDHKGDLVLASVEGHTCFRLMIPAATKEEAHA
ncbi:PAS fold-containing protein [Granulicella rosea]|uniref:histidine kinase n=1 Tax=Granulicella rosea TaxID=474952 RepID=A0A239EX68_9BACT|nr:ATP-binding protein [Granulicella rosea]SNS49177.1 PAS fold-containing protein [Granulicella rosea]